MVEDLQTPCKHSSLISTGNLTANQNQIFKVKSVNKGGVHPIQTLQQLPTN